MKFGVCHDTTLAGIIKDAGFEFLDMSVGGFAMPDASEAEFEDNFAKIKDSALPVLNLNCLLPGRMRLAGPDANTGEAVEYCANAFARAGRAGIKTICFGSGGVRKSPDGWPKDRAFSQICEFLRELSPAVQESGVKLVVENLNYSETNMLNMVSETLEAADSAQTPCIGILIDAYHWARNQDTSEAVSGACSRTYHTHIATYANRIAPGQEDCDFSGFARALRSGGYDGTMSVEAGLGDKSPEAFRKMFSVLKSFF